MLIYFSAIYDRINKTWFGAWAWDESIYGPRETTTTQKQYHIEVTEYKVGTAIQHGRRVLIYKDGIILDGFLKEDKWNGPSLTIYPDGNYMITQNANGKYVSGKNYQADGTPK